MANAIVLAVIGGLLFGTGFGGLVHDAVTRLSPPHQIADGEGKYGAVMGLGLALMLVASWFRERRDPKE